MKKVEGFLKNRKRIYLMLIFIVIIVLISGLCANIINSNKDENKFVSKTVTTIQSKDITKSNTTETASISFSIHELNIPINGYASSSFSYQGDIVSQYPNTSNNIVTNFIVSPKTGTLPTGEIQGEANIYAGNTVGKTEISITVSDGNNSVSDSILVNVYDPNETDDGNTGDSENVDNLPPEVISTSFRSTTGNLYNNNIYVKNGSQIVIEMEFSKKLVTTPVVTMINGSSAVQCSSAVNPSGNIYVVTYKIPGSEKNFNEGELNFNINNYTAENGLSGDPVTKLNDSNNMKIIYDRTKPTIADEDIVYSHEPDNPESPEWRKSQSVTITAHDNITTNDNNIDVQYLWSKENEDGEFINGKNGETITKNDGTGVYYLRVNFTDLAGNTLTKNLGPFYLDTEVSETEMGHVVITKNSIDGEEYIDITSENKEKYQKEGTDEKGNKYYYYEGAYVGDNLYIHKIDGGVKEGEESGHKETTYQVFKQDDNGEYDEEVYTVGEGTTEDIILYHNYNYKIVVTTKDNAGNTIKEEYIVHKGTGNIIFEPDGNTSPVGQAITIVTLVDNNNEYKNIQYAWAKEGEEPKENEYNSFPGIVEAFKQGYGIQSTSAEDFDGKYNLYIKTEDTSGNVNIVRSKTFEIRGKIEQLGTIEFRENSESGNILEAESNVIQTKENVWIKITSQGIDQYGEVETSFRILKDGKTIAVGNKTIEIATLTNEGEYLLTQTSKRVNRENPELEVNNTITYKIIVDKTGPSVEFKDVTVQNAEQGKVEVTISDNKTGLNNDTIKYIWKKGSHKPNKEEFEGIGDNGVRGKVILDENGKATITTPKGLGDSWTLWIYVEDKVGNETIVKDPNKGENQTNEDSEAPIAGKLKLTEVIKEETEDENGNKVEAEEKEYETTENEESGQIEGNYTNNKVKIKLLNGYDASSGIKSNTYTISKDGKTIESNITEEKEITEHGIYEVTVTTIDNASPEHTATRVYTIKIDKNGPQITFTPDGNSEYAKQHELEVNVTEPETESGVDETKTQYVWVGYNPEMIPSKEELINKIKEFIAGKIQEGITVNGEAIKELSTEESIKELEKLGIYVASTQVGQTVKTPEGKTGKYCLLVYAEDNIGNIKMSISNEYYIDNTNPTKPEIKGTKKQIVGTQEKDVEYYGEKTNKEVTVIAQNSKSLSGVDKYEYTYTQDGGKTWTEWTDGTYKETKDEQEETKGKATFTEHGLIVVKFRSIAELIDGTIISEETDEFTVVIDKKGPEVTFSNIENGENGSKESIESVKVRATVTDEEEIVANTNTLKYNWVKFGSVEEFNTYKSTNHSLEGLKTKMNITKATTFSNGEEIPSPENINGIYSLFIYAEDTLGNASVNYSEYYAFNIAKEDKNVYVLAGEYITRVLPETKVEDFIEKVKKVVAGSVYEVYDKDGKQIEEEQNVTTESTVKIDGKTYTIIVVGDLNGDGKLTITDISRMRLSRVGKFELVGAYEKAADINNDGKISLTDLSRMTLIRAGLADYAE